MTPKPSRTVTHSPLFRSVYRPERERNPPERRQKPCLFRTLSPCSRRAYRLGRIKKPPPMNRGGGARSNESVLSYTTRGRVCVNTFSRLVYLPQHFGPFFQRQPVKASACAGEVLTIGVVFYVHISSRFFSAISQKKQAQRFGLLKGQPPCSVHSQTL